MQRRTFINKVAKGSVAVAAATSGINSIAQASELTQSDPAGEKPGTLKPLSLPEDLEKIAGNPALLKKPKGLTVACYTFPNYNASAIHDKVYGPGWTEYNLVRSARPWFEGHAQPRGPLLGELDESLPSTWEKYNTIASESGIDVFIWDWYWYNGEPALHEALENGFLRSANRSKMKFAIMWTNGPWYQLFPNYTTADSVSLQKMLPGPESTMEECWRSMAYIIARYFHQPNYWKIDGKPVITIWDPKSLINNFGKSGVKKLLADLRTFAITLGHKGIYFHVTSYLHNISNSPDFNEDIKQIGFNSRGSYNLTLYAAHLYQPTDTEICDYGVACADIAQKMWPEAYNISKIPYLPTVSIGWDTCPRYIKTNDWNKRVRTSHRLVVFKNESPAAFKAFIQSSFAYLNSHQELPPILYIGCWNEWTEGQYLLPDNRFGYGMLDALAEALEIENPRHVYGHK